VGISIAGPSGVVRWGYHLAARLGAWSFDGQTFRATVIESDPIRLAQSGLRISATLGEAITLADRPVASLSVSAGALVARLGPREAT
jgi:hypothetical protein